MRLPVKTTETLIAGARQTQRIAAITVEIPVGNSKEFVTLRYDPAQDVLNVE